VEPVDPPGALGRLGDQPGLLEEAEVAGHGRPADRHLLRQLANRARPAGQQLDDPAPVGVAQRGEGVVGYRLAPAQSPSPPLKSVTAQLP